MSKKINPILIIPGDKESVFLEIFFKALKIKHKSPIVLIGSLRDLMKHIRSNKIKTKINHLDLRYIDKSKLYLKKLNFINIDKLLNANLSPKRILNFFFIKICFDISLMLIKKNFTNKFINGPINKKNFLNKKHLGVTEYLAEKFNKKDIGMLIYNKELSVCPLTTHLPIKLVSKKITKKLIINRLKMINDFFIKNFKFKPKIAVTGLNPHCESISNYNEDDKIVLPAINLAKKKGVLASGPYSADTIFLKQNRKKYNLILGMYHDQVLSPLKTLYEYDAVNITMGLPFLRVSPDHGPNRKMVNKNLSNPASLAHALKFLDKI